MKKKPWNRCDVCGKFFSWKDFESGAATRYMTSPDAKGSTEEYETLCPEHASPHNREQL